MMSWKHKHTIGAVLGLLIPMQAVAYFTPEEVLLSREFFLPPTAREAQDRTEDQVVRSAEQRDREHALLEFFGDEEPVDVLDEELLTGDVTAGGETGTLKTSAPSTENYTESELQLLRAIRLLDAREDRLLNRVESNQYQYYGSNRLHGGAPPLAPTGAGGILAAMTMIGAVLWTIVQAKRSKKVICEA